MFLDRRGPGGVKIVTTDPTGKGVATGRSFVCRRRFWSNKDAANRVDRAGQRRWQKSNPMVRTTLVATSIEIRAWRNPRDLGYPLLPFSYCQLETTRSGNFESAHVNCNVVDDAASLGFWP